VSWQTPTATKQLKTEKSPTSWRKKGHAFKPGSDTAIGIDMEA